MIMSEWMNGDAKSFANDILTDEIRKPKQTSIKNVLS